MVVRGMLPHMNERLATKTDAHAMVRETVHIMTRRMVFGLSAFVIIIGSMILGSGLIDHNQ